MIKAITPQYGFLAICVLALLSLSAGSVVGLDPHLNISFSEIVYQNVTFAQYFNLVENRTGSLIVGTVTVDNPGTETVYDAHIKVNNTEYLASDFVYNSGRLGYQVIYPKTTDNVTNLSMTINTSYQTLGMDIDEDRVNDFVKVNDTHIIFNVSSEFQELGFAIYNTTGQANLASSQFYNTTVINVTSARVTDYNENVVFARLSINGSTTTANALNGSELTLTMNDTNRNYTILHIPELRSGQFTIFGYNVSSLFVDPPLDIDTMYTQQPYQSKVLAGQRFTINDSATNIAQVGSLIILNITIEAQEVNVTNDTVTETFNFTLHNLSATGDYANVYDNETNNRTWYWVTNGGSIPINGTYNITYQVQAPPTVPTSGTYPAVRQNLTYQINTTASRVGVEGVRVRSDVNFTVDKQIIAPADNASNNNVTWQSIPKVGSFQNITYTLEKVTLWVTTTLDPNIIANNLTTTYTPNSVVNLSTSWIGSSWLFNFTDGSSDSAPPPIVWIKPYWIIQNAYGQILNQSVTNNGTDTYIKYIYVINGYWLEVQKNVTSASNSSYDIRVYVHNRGNGYTPQNMTVTVYDFIPDEFTGYNFTPNYNNLSNVTGQFNGTAYQWDVGLRTNISTSFSPEGAADGYDDYYLNYSANGTGDYRVSDLYIIGLDPRAVDGASAQNDDLTVLSAIVSSSKELIYLGIVVFLIAINIGNFLMTSRINKKLDKDEPEQKP